MIYCVEDDDSIRKLVIYALESQGFTAAGFAVPSAFWKAMGKELPELILQATKVERVHADKPSVPKGLTKYLTMLHEELSSHMMKEEQILFPMIKQGMGSQAMGPISVMESEHDEAGELLEVIKHTTNNVTPPPEACTTWKAMYNGINELIDDLMDHISLENNVLFPRALAGE